VSWSPDTIGLDVDGVLVDVHASFRETIRQVVPRFQMLQGNAAPWTPSVDDISAFKRAGGFNDDIDLSAALCLLAVAGRGAEAASIAARTEERGGGMSALHAALGEEVVAVDGALVLQLFNECYWGDEYGELFGTPPRHFSGPGLRRHEAPMVAPDFPATLREAGAHSIALITGRTVAELDSALELLKWDRADVDIAITGDVLRKPDPACLEAVVRHCDTRRVVFLGDTRDDWELVRRYNAEGGTAEARGILVGDWAGFGDVQPHARLGHTNELLPLLEEWRA
jgi:phosphoglycolate phosphatase-like HAD superfamily hydrolase